MVEYHCKNCGGEMKKEPNDYYVCEECGRVVRDDLEIIEL